MRKVTINNHDLNLIQICFWREWIVIEQSRFLTETVICKQDIIGVQVRLRSHCYLKILDQQKCCNHEMYKGRPMVKMWWWLKLKMERNNNLWQSSFPTKMHSNDMVGWKSITRGIPWNPTKLEGRNWLMVTGIPKKYDNVDFQTATISISCILRENDHCRTLLDHLMFELSVYFGWRSPLILWFLPYCTSMWYCVGCSVHDGALLAQSHQETVNLPGTFFICILLRICFLSLSWISWKHASDFEVSGSQ